MERDTGEAPAPLRVAAVIVAAGSSRRMQGIRKIWAALGDSSVLAHTLAAFQASPLIETVVMVLAPDDLEAGRALCNTLDLTKATLTIGGARRRDSVRAGLDALAAFAPDYVVIHDGARPFVTPDLIARGVQAARQHGAAVAAVPVKDTMKRAGPDGLVLETLDRAALWAVQTPQVFAYDLLMRAHRALDPAWDATDDAALVERLGHPVALFTGLDDNIKITTPGDLLLAEAILKGRQAREEKP